MSDSKITEAFAALAEDVSEQALRAHLDGKPEASDAMYGVASAVRRVLIDVLDQDSAGEPRGWREKIGLR